MGLILKTGSATCLLGFAGCGIMCASGCTNTIKQQLIEEGFTLISSKDAWDKKLEKYGKDFVNIKGTINLEKSCQTILKQSPDKENWRRAVKWCVEEKTVKEILEKKYKLLDTLKDDDKAEWENKVNKLKKSKKEEFKKWKDSMNSNNPDGPKLKEECKKLKPSIVSTNDENFNDIFQKTKEFCAKK